MSVLPVVAKARTLTKIVLQADPLSNSLMHVAAGYVVTMPSGRSIYTESWLSALDADQGAAALVTQAWSIVQVGETDFAGVQLAMRTIEAHFDSAGVLVGLELVYDAVAPGFEHQRRVPWVMAPAAVLAHVAQLAAAVMLLLP